MCVTLLQAETLETEISDLAVGDSRMKKNEEEYGSLPFIKSGVPRKVVTILS